MIYLRYVILTTFFILVFYEINICQNSILAYNDFQKSQTNNYYKFHLPKANANCSKTKIWVNWAALSTTAISSVVGLIYLGKARQSYDNYKSFKNDILYQNNLTSFSTNDLQKYEFERKILYDKAISEQKNGQILLGAGIAVITVHYTLSKINKKCPFRLRDWK